MIHRASGDEVAVYRLYDGEGCLLYVGISKDPLNRWQEHVSKRWWADVASYEVRWYESRAAARAAEKTAMADENPTHNIHSSRQHGAYWGAALNTPEARAQRAARRAARRPKKGEEASDG